MLMFLGLVLACQEEKNDFSFSVSSGSEAAQDESETPENTQEPESQPEEEPASEPEVVQEPSDAPSAECAIPPESYDTPPQELQGRVDCGEDVYMSQCANCHGAQGQGTSSGQGLQGHVQGHSDLELIQSIVYGEGTMPPIDLENQEVADVLAYMRAYF